MSTAGPRGLRRGALPGTGAVAGKEVRRQAVAGACMSPSGQVSRVLVVSAGGITVAGRRQVVPP